jgi:hypothetical protein
MFSDRSNVNELVDAAATLYNNPLTPAEDKEVRECDKPELIIKRFKAALSLFQQAAKLGHLGAIQSAEKLRVIINTLNSAIYMDTLSNEAATNDKSCALYNKHESEMINLAKDVVGLSDANKIGQAINQQIKTEIAASNPSQQVRVITLSTPPVMRFHRDMNTSENLVDKPAPLLSPGRA